MKATIYNQDGKQVKDMELADAVFGLPWNEDLVHQVIVAMRANMRTPIAHVKNRGEVAGSGIKPWRQKGTGRARHGSKRSPIWVGGGISHGPRKDRDYSQKINKKMKKKALYTILSQKLRDNQLMFLNKIVLAKPKTKDAAEIIKSLAKVENFGRLVTKKKNRVILALPFKDEGAAKSFRNIPGLTVTEARNINPLDLINYQYAIFVDPETSVTAIKKSE